MPKRKAVAAIDVCPFGRRCLCRSLRPTQHRQRQVLHRLLAGDSDKQVALALDIKQRTVEVYIKQLHRRFEVCSRGELTALALRARLIRSK